MGDPLKPQPISILGVLGLGVTPCKPLKGLGFRVYKL